MQNHLMKLYNQEASTSVDAEDDEPAVTSEGLTCEDHDLGMKTAQPYSREVSGRVS